MDARPRGIVTQLAAVPTDHCLGERFVKALGKVVPVLVNLPDCELSAD